MPEHADYERLLRDRADSYWRDSIAFREDGDLHASVAYKMIAEELRRCAAIVRDGRGRAVSAPACCEAAAPPYSGYRQDGDTFTCSTCRSRWLWVEDEAEGGSFVRDTWGNPVDGTELIDRSGE